MSTSELSSPRQGWIVSPLAARRAWLAVDSNEPAIAFASTRLGSFALSGMFIALLAMSLQLSMAALALTGVALLAMVALPRHRFAILMGASVFYFAMRPFRISQWSDLAATETAILGLPALSLQLASVVLFLVFALGILSLQRRLPRSFLAKRPVLTVIVGWFGLLALALLTSAGSYAHAALWTLTGVSVSSIWFLAYAAIDQRGKDPTSLAARAGFMRPFWGGSAAPIGKSFGYLNKFSAKDDRDLAVTRLKALKLAVWALILTGVWQVFDWILFYQLGLPELQSAVLSHAAGQSAPVAVNWAVVLSNYLLDLLIISVWGHFIVASVRMVGYRIPRNTVNPLAARTLAEFWNRYFFYFKELLVDMFFYPAFVRYFKGNVKLRIAFATLCAAGLGNFLYHFMRETYVFADGISWEKLAIFQSAVFYSLALAAGLIVSQWRGRKPVPENGFLRYHVLPRVNVIAFFCFLKIFDDLTGDGSLLERAAFFLSLFGA